MVAASFMTAVSGCAHYGNPNLQVQNRPENQGVAQFGSEACRAAKATVQEIDPRAPMRAMMPYRSQYPYMFNHFSRFGFGGLGGAVNGIQPIVQSAESGKRYLILSQASETHFAESVGAGVAARDARRYSYGGRYGDRSLGGMVGRSVNGALAVGAGQAAGAVIDNVVNGIRNGGNAYELVERCQADVAAGAYDVQYMGPNGRQGYQSQMAPRNAQDANSFNQLYMQMEPRR